MYNQSDSIKNSILFPIILTVAIAVITLLCYYFLLPAIAPSPLELAFSALSSQSHWFFFAPYVLFALSGISIITVWILWCMQSNKKDSSVNVVHLTNIETVPISTPSTPVEQKQASAPCKRERCVQISYTLSDGVTKRSTSVSLKRIKDFNGFTIGSHSSCGLVINDSTVHAKHLDLRIRENRLYVKCLSGKMRVQGAWHEANVQSKIHQGEAIAIGGVVLIFSL